MAESNGEGRRQKRRGVRASRVKLERALGESNLGKKTQAALAERIADIEQLDAAPKDLVSKVFRELYVDPQTLERVARALGVDAQSLHLEMTQSHQAGETGVSNREATARGEVASQRPIPRRAAILAAASIAAAFLASVMFVALAVYPADSLCGLREAAARPRTAEGMLGLMVTRFADDPDNRAQQYLSATLAADQNLSPYVSVLATCARPRWTGPGELRRRLAQIREKGRMKLARADAHLMLWGKLDGDDIVIRFISTRRDISAYAVEISGRPLKVNESNLELRLPLGRPSEALADLKRLSLELVEAKDDEQAQLRSAAMQTYRSSADWLRAAIVSQRNLRRTIGRESEPQRWAAVNMQLCYDLRLLGDYEANADRYKEAIEACDEALRARPQNRFPRDWVSAQINRASSLIRLHYFAPDRAGALSALEEAEAALVAALAGSDPEKTPQQWITAQRNLGVVSLRLGELTEGAASSAHFEKGIALLRAALDAQDPAFQPLDWAITQQNICLALYQHGARLGSGGAVFVREAKSRCAEAVARLSPQHAPLDWAMAQNNLAAATAILAQFEGDADGLAMAIGDFSAAQTVYTRDRLPENWAEVELNLGELRCNLALLKQDPGEFERALTHLDASLEVFIDKGNERYRLYAENLASSIKACDANAIENCACGG